ncbi:MAG: DUF1206 domain-containing protein [Pleurocapsa sp. SU_5_0]|nr:DUF1206 domain-containing protein [Pleurocapsa sp. SU_5_0]NJO97085.1 DUF1206 domain-containing protein [Pleurocapsa sp. CRU_1_2]NJR45182.1 DUF1206 domain-containing protein [Hyellaceae cyanobacterium CSU_1_1]
MIMEKLARFGYAAKGFVYGAIAILALLVAFSIGGKTTDTTGALQTISQQYFGKLLLILIAIGLVGYVLWLLIQAIKDPEHKGTDAKGIFSRLGYAITALAYMGVASNAALLAFGKALLALMAFGLLSYAIYLLLQARFRRIKIN